MRLAAGAKVSAVRPAPAVLGAARSFGIFRDIREDILFTRF